MRESIDALLAGDVATGKTILCDYILPSNRTELHGRNPFNY